MNEKILPFPGTDDAGADAGQLFARANLMAAGFPPTVLESIPAPPPLPANVIPFPATGAGGKSSLDNIIVVPFGSVDAGLVVPATFPEPELPGAPSHMENPAGTRTVGGAQSGLQRNVSATVKRPSDRGFRSSTLSAAHAEGSAGTNGAETSASMNPAMRPKPSQRLNDADSAVHDCQSNQEQFRADGVGCADSSAREPGAKEWHEGRPVRCMDRSAPEFPPAPDAPESAAAADRIFLLLLREVLLARQYGSDSMAVMLRPDEETELVLHLSDHRGRLEASVRCERGNIPLLRTIWSQIQASMALQRVDVSPLQESLVLAECDVRRDEPPHTLLGASAFTPAHEPETDSMDEGPSPALPAAPSIHQRRTRRSRNRLTTSRPGWETWA